MGLEFFNIKIESSKVSFVTGRWTTNTLKPEEEFVWYFCINQSLIFRSPPISLKIKDTDWTGLPAHVNSLGCGHHHLPQKGTPGGPLTLMTPEGPLTQSYNWNKAKGVSHHGQLSQGLARDMSTKSPSPVPMALRERLHS